MQQPASLPGNRKSKTCPEQSRRILTRKWAWLCLAALLHVEAALGAATQRIVWPKTIEVSQGELVEVHVSGGELVSVEGMFAGAKIIFHETAEASFSALLGADVDAKPSVSKLRLIGRFRSGAEMQAEVSVHVLAKLFRQESFNVAPGFDQTSAETLDEIRREQAAFARVFASPEPTRLWDAPFVRPVPHEASASSFGSRRVINGKPRAPHSGTDLSAPAGTEVAAANHGRVALSGNFFFAGGSIVLDHGGGLFTMYFHLSELRVGEGTMVRKGDVLGLSGATGRVTGAHLHWGARLANARVDPMQLLKKIAGPWPPVVPAMPVDNAGEK